MRLPLGVLSGMGFIGAGAILRRGNLILGITTAATLWFVTLLGLCFGSGQMGLGLAGLALGCLTLWGMKYAERFMHPQVRGTLSITIRGGGFDEEELRRQVAAAKCRIISWACAFVRDPERHEIDCDLEWRPSDTTAPPPIIETLRADPSIARVSWRPQGATGGSDAQQTQPTGRPPALGRESTES
jgi:putative Mg2+ transporter-C (MgtC) family protein